jgi:asparagine synthase (glutamine-hydrolysing)
MFEFYLSSKNPYKWTYSNNAYLIGYVVDKKNVFRHNSAIDKITFSDQKIHSGIYSFILVRNDKVLISNDINNFFPVFCYYKSGSGWIISDSFEKILQFKEFELNDDVVPAFETAGFVPDKFTLDKKIIKSRAGYKLILQNDGNFYYQGDYYWLTKTFFDRSFNDLLELTSQKIFEAGERMVRFLNGRMAVVPLSGGFDSRLIACLLKKFGYKNVICFTYGKYTHETGLSKKVAETLGFKWYFIDYTQLNYSEYTKDETFLRYVSDYANGYCMPYLQEYFAVKYLKENNLIDENAVFLPGHSGDYLAGSYINKTIATSATDLKLANHIAQKYFYFRKKKHKEHSQIRQIISETLKEYKGLENTLIDGKFNQTVEDWDIKEKLAKFIVRSCFIFTFFGYEFYLLYWDINLLDYFRKIPFRYRENKKLYDECLIQKFFTPEQIYFGEKEIKSGRIKFLYQKFKDNIRYFFPWKTVLERMQKFDWMNYYEFTKEMNEEIFSNTGKYLKNFKTFNAVICRWYLLILKKLHLEKQKIEI